MSHHLCAILPCTAPATTVLGARPACQACADDARAFLATSRVPKFGTVEEELLEHVRAAALFVRAT